MGTYRRLSHMQHMQFSVALLSCVHTSEQDVWCWWPKARSPAVDNRDLRTTNLLNEADRSRVLEPSSAAHCKSSVRYWGAILLRHLNTRTANRNLIRSGTRSQWSSLKHGRTCDGCKSVSLWRWALTVDGPWAVLRCRLELYFRNQVATGPMTKLKTAELVDWQNVVCS